MKLVFDTNVLISSTLWYGSSAQKLLNKLISIGHSIYITEEIISEYRKVLARDFKFSSDKIDEFVDKILLFVNLVKPLEDIDFIKEDPDDNIILECAAESGADYILSYDKHLLKLGSFRDIKIIKPENLIM